ncbi:hypothetical protein HBN50_00075 [Halobacteriovorax sp. GB3]|uniref:hypothetical protein n=1 Tax=Halobacteriovorax sp. GB3 TaxID=2719615 RepID=UPI00235FFDD0|nr:hypothetical protein [Halobacteriovorax sp. GB3]MDD0851462.1 hypothetical protein [Halobacteriovorax sp. GB3]
MRKRINIANIVLGLCLFASISSYGQELSFNVEKYQPTEFDYMFEIQNKNFEKVTLDCQSFINGLDFRNDKNEQIALFMLDIAECEDIHHRIKSIQSENKMACIDLDFSRRLYDVKESDESCI